MKKEILEKIDLLVEMSSSSNSYENLHEEYLSLTQEIEDKKKVLKELKKNIASQKYMKSNERIIDENIKIGLENRLDDHRGNLKELLSDIETYSNTEESCHNKIVSFETDLSTLRRYLASLELKMKSTSKEQETYQSYEELYDQASTEIGHVEESLKSVRKEYNEITKVLAELGEERFKLETKISNDEEKLEEIEASLANPDTYIDQKAQQKDEAYIDSYTDEIEKLEKRKIEILTDPAYIGHEAQELYLDDDVTSALEKIKELVTIVQTKPYMEVEDKDLDALLSEAEQKRDEYASEIENKTYDGNEKSFLNDRIEYLEELKSTYEYNQKQRREIIDHIDKQEVPKLVVYVSKVKENRSALKRDIDDYIQVLEDTKDQKTPKKKASLQAALKKKQEELATLENILLQFETDLESRIIESKELEENNDYQQKIENIEKEIAELKKLTLSNSRGKDILAIEKDKEELKKYNDDVNDLIHRKKYAVTPKEIYEEVEALVDNKGTSFKAKEVIEEPVNLDDYRIDLPIQEEIEEEKAEISSLDDIFIPAQEEILPIDEPVLEIPNIVFDESQKEELEDIQENTFERQQEEVPEEKGEEELIPALDVFEFSPGEIFADEQKEEELPSNRHKVISIEDLNVKEEVESPSIVEELADDTIMINDFEDTDYISFNDLLEGDVHEN